MAQTGHLVNKFEVVNVHG